MERARHCALHHGAGADNSQIETRRQLTMRFYCRLILLTPNFYQDMFAAE